MGRFCTFSQARRVRAMVLAMIKPEPPSASESGKKGGRGKKNESLSENKSLSLRPERLSVARTVYQLLAKKYDAMKTVGAVETTNRGAHTDIRRWHCDILGDSQVQRRGPWRTRR
jgi:hypothetical protein